MLDKILAFIADRLGVNHIIEEGVSNSITYRKWANGEIEYWTGVSVKFNNETFKSAVINFPMPMTDNSYRVAISVNNSGNYVKSAGVFSSNGSNSKTINNVTVTFNTVSAFNYSMGADVYIKGRWK